MSVLKIGHMLSQQLIHYRVYSTSIIHSHHKTLVYAGNATVASSRDETVVAKVVVRQLFMLAK